LEEEEQLFSSKHSHKNRSNIYEKGVSDLLHLKDAFSQTDEKVM
jgi:hypothetical protein